MKFRKNSPKSIFLILFSVLSFVSFMVGVQFGTAQNSTNVTGIISSDTTWTKANSPYTLTGPILVGNGVTLTIEAGVTVNLNSYYIRVSGKLVARGNSGDKIHVNGGEIEFTFVSESWNEQTGSGSIIDNAILSSTSLDINDTSPKISSNSIINGHIDGHEGSFIISNNNIIGDGYYAVIITGFGSPVISNNIIISDNNHNIGIRASGNSVISNNIIKGGGDYGIKGGKYVSDNIIYGFYVGIYTSIGTVERNLVINNTRGIEVGMYASVIRNNTIANNTVGIFSPKGSINYNNIHDNSEHNMQLDMYAEGDVTATYNWWGTTDVQSINQSIYDFKNDFNLGTVNFVPFLTAPNPKAPAITALPPNFSPPSQNPPTTTPDQTNNQTTPQTGLNGIEIAILAVLVVIVVLLIITIGLVLKKKQ